MSEDREKAEKASAVQMENLQSLNSQLSLLTGEQARLEARITKLEEDAETVINRLWDDYELTYLTAEKYRHDIEDVAAEQKNLASVKAKIKALGNVNLDAIEEYAASSERYEFLVSQRDDILLAKAELENLIGEITTTMTQLFEENFAVLKTTFKETFKELFGGGDADLSLSNPQEILESGVEINVQPPGKKLQSITLLSGGEKAFTAIALIFAILKINPTQFCVFDEIEAALDDVNVFRYADYLKRLCDHTQFIVITHRKGTMEAADTLYGVTMQEKGVTRMVSLDMNSI
jgi:chromosome segregation protein